MAEGSFETAGLRLAPVAGQPGAWTYVPLIPGIAGMGGGRPQFTLIEAGAMAMLALTTTLAASDKAIEAARQAIAARENQPKDKITLSPAPIEVGEVTLLLGDGAGGSVPLATTRSSGASPYQAAFNVTLDPGQRDRVKRAAAGARGWLGVSYAITELGPPRREASASYTSDATARASASQTTEGETRSAEAMAALSEFGAMEMASGGRTATAQTVRSDAADWGLGRS